LYAPEALLDWIRQVIRYLETFFRHRLLVLMPLLLAGAMSIGISLAQPRSFESSARIWFYGSSLSPNAAQPGVSVADRQAAVFIELLGSQAFDLKVGQRGPLTAYVAATNGPESLVSRILARLGLSSLAGQPPSVDDQVSTILRKRVTVVSSGPEVVAISLRAADPEVARGTVQALVDQFSDEVLANRKTEAQTVVDFFDQQVKDQAAAVASAGADLSKYAAAHPRAAGTDVTLIALQHTADTAKQRYDESLLQLGQAKLDLAAQSQAGGSGFRVIDPPTAPSQPLSRLSDLLRAVMGGLLAGLLVAACGLIALTAADSSVRRAAEIRQALGLRVVGEIPLLRSRT
jgi:uncharacterized protein involved in exopolysaccharide biosynthesis